MTFQKHFRAFSGKRLNVNRIRIRQRHHEQSHFRQFALQPHIREPEVDLSLTGRVRERQEYFAIRLLPRSNGILDDRLATFVIVFILSPTSSRTRLPGKPKDCLNFSK